MLRLTFIDTESAWDEYLHEDYRAIDPKGVAKLERQGRKRHNQACKRIFAAAARTHHASEPSSSTSASTAGPPTADSA